MLNNSNPRDDRNNVCAITRFFHRPAGLTALFGVGIVQGMAMANYYPDAEIGCETGFWFFSALTVFMKKPGACYGAGVIIGFAAQRLGYGSIEPSLVPRPR